MVAEAAEVAAVEDAVFREEEAGEASRAEAHTEEAASTGPGLRVPGVSLHWGP
jgi:hypothetical protein